MPSYAKAPITEALIEIQIKETGEPSIDVIGDELSKQLATDYPHRYPLKEGTIEAQFGPEGELRSATNAMVAGWRFVSDDGKQAASARINGLAFSRLSPYQNWDSLRREVSTIWTFYRSIVKPAEVVRLGMRYINRLDLPLPFSDFNEFLRATPQIPAEIPQFIQQYFFQATVYLEDVKSSLTLSHGLVPPAKPDHASVILDISLSREQEVPQVDSEIWDVFNLLRAKRNFIFENCITQKMKELIS